MEPPFSTRSLAPASTGDYSSRGLPQQQQKRKAAGIIKASGNGGVINDSSESGYSADRESLSTVHPTFVSINLHSSCTMSSSRYDSNYPKRRKKNEMQYAATTVKEDLSRAYVPYKKIDTENSKTFNALENVNNINLQDHVRLVHSGTVLSDTLLNLSSSNNTHQTMLPPDYLGMINAVRNFYPPIGGRMTSFKTSTAVRSKDTWSAPSTSSDVSDTESDSGSGSENDNNTNAQNKVISISPLLEDSLQSQIGTNNNDETQGTTTVVDAAATTQISIDQMLSSLSSNAITMADILQLSKTARIVISSSVPFSIIHANAAFYHLLGERLTDAVIGTSLFSLLDPKCNQFEDEVSPAKFVLSSSATTTTTGDKKKLYMLPPNQDNGKNDHPMHHEVKPIECFIRVSPIVSRKDETQEEEATNVEYFAIEFIPESNEHNAKLPSLFSTNTNSPMEVVA